MLVIQRITSFLLLSLLLVGCTTPPLIIGNQHPASVAAAESPVPTPVRMLRLDADTRRTKELLAERETQAWQSEAEPASTTLPATPPNQKKMDHSTMDMSMPMNH